MDKKLLDVCEFIIDCEHKTAPLVEKSNFISIRTPNIGEGYFLLDGVNRVSEETYRQWTRRAVPQKDDLIMAREAPAGNVAIIRSERDVCLGQRTVLIRPNPEKVNPNYLCYLLLSEVIQIQIEGKSTGATVAHLNMSDIRSLKLPLMPEVDTQKRIAEVLVAYDELVDVNKRRIKLLEEISLGIYKEWFVRMRFLGYKNLKFRKGLPETWDIKKLGDISEFINRGISPDYDENGTSLVLNQRCVRDNKIDFEVARRQNKIISSNKLLLRGDVLINSTGEGTLGRTAQLNENVQNLTADSHLTIARPKHGFSKEFYGMAVRSFENYFELMALGSTGQTELGRKVVSDVLVKVPTNKILEIFSNIINPINEQLICFLKQNIQLRQIRDRLLPRMMGSDNLPMRASGKSRQAVVV